MFSETQEMIALGGRRLTLSMLAAREQADRFEGLPRGMAKPLRFLAAFQEAEPHLGLPAQAFKLVAWLVKMTQAQDWEAGARPIVWPSAARQQEFLGLGPSAVKTLNRILFAAGVFVLRDSPTGKRYGRRDDQGRIVEAYGFDLSPLASRAEEFIRLAAEARAERQRMQALKRRATCARRAVAQIGAALAEAGALPCGWARLAAETAERTKLVRKARASAELAAIVKDIEALRNEALAWGKEAFESTKTDPVGPPEQPHVTTTNKPSHPSDTVTAAEDKRDEAAKVQPQELLQLAPRLAMHVAEPRPDWADVARAAGEGLRRELGVSQSLWGEACLTIGRWPASVALAIVSTKPPEHFRQGAGGYFAAMVKRAKQGELRLDRSLWKLRRDRLQRLGLLAARAP